jgi:ADP-heptose:LPS heptosyltransferase
MGERSRTRAAVVSRALVRRLRRGPPASEVRRVLVAHNLLLGDVVMLTPLLAKLRANHPAAEIVVLAAPSLVPLYAGRPYGVRVLPFSPKRSDTTRALLKEAPFDLAVVVGDNRYSWVAAALGARRVVAHAGDPSWSRNLMVDEQRPYRTQPAAWGDMVADLVDGREPPAYRVQDWPAPPAKPFDAPAVPYAVLHVGASTPLKHWPPDRWRAVADALEARGLQVVWSAGPGEEAVVAACDPQGRRRSYAGRLDLAQMWHLLAGAALVVAPDTGIAHLSRATGAPTIAIFGPGSATACQNGSFWRDMPYRGLTAEDFPCRDQQLLFGREVVWMRRCTRSTSECAEPRCMQAVEVGDVLTAAERMLGPSRNV